MEGPEIKTEGGEESPHHIFKIHRNGDHVIRSTRCRLEIGNIDNTDFAGLIVRLIVKERNGFSNIGF